MLEKLKEDTHPQVRAQLQRGLLKCQCGFMKLSRTTKNYSKVFLNCGSFLPGQEPCGYFQWLHGPLWRPREQAQPSLRRWVKGTPHGNGPYDKDPVALLKKHCLDRPTLQPMHYGTRGPTGWTSMAKTPIMPDRQWLNQFAESVAAQERERRNHFQSKFGSGTLLLKKKIM